MDRGLSLSPTSIAAGMGETPRKTNLHLYAFRLVAGAGGGPTPLVQGPQDPPLDTPAERSANANLHRNATLPQGSKLGDWLRSLALVTYRPSPIGSHMTIINNIRELRSKEARKIADLENQRDSLRSQLKETEESASSSKKC